MKCGHIVLELVHVFGLSREEVSFFIKSVRSWSPLLMVLNVLVPLVATVHLVKFVHMVTVLARF